MFRSRRDFLCRTCNGIGAMALAGMLSDELGASQGDINPMAVKPPHFPRKAKTASSYSWPAERVRSIPSTITLRYEICRRPSSQAPWPFR